MIDDIILNKKESIERCIKQIRDYYNFLSDLEFSENFMKQDAIAINIQRAAELCIDIANHIIKVKKLGIPKETNECFEILKKNKLITAELLDKLIGMVGFRNILVHEYKKMDIKIMINVIENRLIDFLSFTEIILKL
jgi:uncharacterized protein YutE (UPF0331/DUF86 family)